MARALTWLTLLLLLSGASAAQEDELPPLSPDEEELFQLEVEPGLAPETLRPDSVQQRDDSLFGSIAGDSLFYGLEESPTAPLAREGESWDLYPKRRLPFAEETLQNILRRSPLGDGEPQRWTEIFRADSTLTLSMVQIREEAWPCYYPYSDLWVYIWRGWGKLILGEDEHDYSPGAFFQVPAGTVHAFHNVSGAPTVALIWQSPPIDELRVEIIPEEILAEMQADSLRLRDLEERSLYRGGGF